MVVPISEDRGSSGDGLATARLTSEFGATLALDGYEFGATFQKSLRGRAGRRIIIDDYGRVGSYEADLVLDQNPGSEPRPYRGKPGQPRALIGPRFFLLRRELRQWRAIEPEYPEVARRIVVAPGGAAPAQTYARMLAGIAAARLESVDVTLVAGPGCEDAGALDTLASDSAFPVRIVKMPPDVGAVLASADLALACGGATTWELAYLGVPGLLYIAAENQVPVVQAAQREGVALAVGPVEEVEPAELGEELSRLARDRQTRLDMGARGRNLVDGNGAVRVCAALRDEVLVLRHATRADARFIWELSNDPLTRAASFASDHIEWDDHQRWFAAKLRDPTCLFLMAEDDVGGAVAQLRCEVEGADGVVSISVAASHRGRGVGTGLLRLLARRAFGCTAVGWLVAYVKPENHPSVKVFQRAGYEPEGTSTVRDQPALRFVLRRKSIST